MYDFHVHSDYSIDCKYLMDEMVKTAVENNIKAICFTDHIDYEITKDGIDIDFRVEDYLKKINQMKYNFGNKIDIYSGIEIGVQPHLYSRYNNLVEENKLDFILMSIHTIDGERMKDIKFTEDNLLYYIERYYDLIYDAVSNFNNYDILSHFDYIDKYILGDGLELPDFSLYSHKLERILKKVIENKKGIELNTSAKRHGLDTYYPKREILEMYRDLGGDVITMASNSHEPDSIAYEFREAEKYLKELGFKYFYIYKERKKYPIHTV